MPGNADSKIWEFPLPNTVNCIPDNLKTAAGRKMKPALGGLRHGVDGACKES